MQHRNKIKLNNLNFPMSFDVPTQLYLCVAYHFINYITFKYMVLSSILLKQQFMNKILCCICRSIERHYSLAGIIIGMQIGKFISNRLKSIAMYKLVPYFFYS